MKKRQTVSILAIIVGIALVSVIPLIFPQWSAAQPSRQAPGETTAFVPAYGLAGEVIIASAFNASDRARHYRVEIRDGITGQLLADPGDFLECMNVAPKTGCMVMHELPVRSLVVITIIGILVPDSAELPIAGGGRGRRATPALVSAQIRNPTDSSVRQLLPAVQKICFDFNE